MEEEKPEQGMFATSAGTDLYRYTGKLSQVEFDRMLAAASMWRASDVTVQPGLAVMAEIAGKWRRITHVPLNVPEVQSIVRSIYGENGTTMLSTGRDLDFAYEIRNPMRNPETLEWEPGYELQPVRLRFRTNITAIRAPGGGDGASITMRSLPSQPPAIYRIGIDPVDKTKIGIEQDILTHWRPEQGLNLVCGPTGSGKSTLLSSMVRWRCEQPDACEKVLEFSSPIEYVYDGLDFPSSFVSQTGVGKHLINHEERSEGGVWGYCIRNSLRRKPSTIILGEARDRHTIEGCIQAALSGHLTVSTLHTIGVPETFRRLVMPFPAAERATISVDLMQVLNLVVTQLLLRRVGGGKVAIREYMVFDAGVRRSLEDVPPDNWPKMLRQMLSCGYTPEGRPIIGQAMDKAAQALHEQGLISEEDMRFASSRAASEEEN